MNQITFNVTDFESNTKQYKLYESDLLKVESYFSKLISFEQKSIYELEDEHFVIDFIFKYLKFGVWSKRYNHDEYSLKLLDIRTDYYCLEELNKLINNKLNQLLGIVKQKIPYKVDPIDTTNGEIRREEINSFKLWDSAQKQFCIDMKLIKYINYTSNNILILLKCNGRWCASTNIVFNLDQLNIQYKGNNINKNNIIFWEGNSLVKILDESIDDSKNGFDLELNFTYSNKTLF